MAKLFNLYIENPLKTWWKVRKLFKFPNISIKFFYNPRFNCPYISLKSIGKLLDIWSSDVVWKDKYNTPYYEESPFVWFCLLGKFGFSIDFHIYYKDKSGKLACGDIYYWEYILDYLYYNKDLNKSCNNWVSLDGFEVPTKQMSLKNG